MPLPLRPRLLVYGLLAAFAPVLGLISLWNATMMSNYLADPVDFAGRLISLAILPWAFVWFLISLVAERAWSRRSEIHPAHFIPGLGSLVLLELLSRPVMRGVLVAVEPGAGNLQDSWRTELSVFLSVMLALLVALYLWVVPVLTKRVLLPFVKARFPASSFGEEANAVPSTKAEARNGRQ